MDSIDSTTVLIKESASILALNTSENFKDPEDNNVERVGKSDRIAPWGSDNLLPQHVVKAVEKNEVMGANCRFNRDVCYGIGPRLVRRSRDGEGSEPVTSGKEYEFFMRNDIPMQMYQLISDMSYFNNAFLEIIPDNEGKIYQVRAKEAAFSRFGVMDSKGVINYHYYCADWNKKDSEKVVKTYVVDEFDTGRDLTIQMAARRNVIYPIYMPSPGRPYYSRPEWYSLFLSGWYDHYVTIPALKQAIFKNKLGVQYIIYVSEEYFESVAAAEGVDIHDPKAYRDLKDREKKAFCEFLSGADNAAKALMAIKEWLPTAGGGINEKKWIEIVPIDNKIDGGEYIDDTESCANIICYSMGVHPSLIGATPGKSGNSQSGTDKRELFMMKQALVKPVVNRVLLPFDHIAKFNGWDPDIRIDLPEYVFTTLDQSKSGKVETSAQSSAKEASDAS